MNIGPHAAVTLIAVGLALAVTAGYLIHVARILWVVIDRLVTILGVVEAVSEKSQPIGPVLDDINRDLDSSAKALEACVQRLEDRRRAAEEPPPRAPVAPTSAAAAPAATTAPPGRGWWNR